MGGVALFFNLLNRSEYEEASVCAFLRELPPVASSFFILNGTNYDDVYGYVFHLPSCDLDRTEHKSKSGCAPPMRLFSFLEGRQCEAVLAVQREGNTLL